MALGKLYKPSGKALETCKKVLCDKKPYALNIAEGCSNNCTYCYGPNSTFQSREDYQEVRHPDGNPLEMVKEQLDGGYRSVFMSFLTDPFLEENRGDTEKVIDYLSNRGYNIGTLSKLGVYDTENAWGIRNGMTIVSLEEDFHRKFEPNTLAPKKRVEKLRRCSENGGYTWVSVEPLPCPAIYENDFRALLGELKFVDFMILGKWNYDDRAGTGRARAYYSDMVMVFRDFCRSNGIRFHVKEETKRFVEG